MNMSTKRPFDNIKQYEEIKLILLIMVLIVWMYGKDGKTNTLKNSCSKHQQALFFAPTAHFDKIIRKRMSR